MAQLRNCILGLALVLGQAGSLLPNGIAGYDVEQNFRLFRDRLAAFFLVLRSTVEEVEPELLAEINDPPPEPIEYGYQILPPIVAPPNSGLSGDRPPQARSYSWPITQQYVDNENERLARAESRLSDAARTRDLSALAELVDQYRLLVDNQKIIDQHVQYNRFWQRTVAEDRPRFDRLTELYKSMVNGDPDIVRTIREALGQPTVPSFLRVDRSRGEVVLRLPVYTDILDGAYLRQVEEAVEDTWRVSDSGTRYVLDIEFRFVSVEDLYAGQEPPSRGDHLDLEAHAARFPTDGAILTTGAESTHAFPGRSVLLGSGEVSPRTLAHEFGHLLGFRDGYIRGYRDLGADGFEILELTSAFDDIMSAPGEGGVAPAHFRLIVDAVGSRSVD